MTTVLLLSGGLDSTCLLYDLHAQGVMIHALLVNYQQAHVRELDFAKLHCKRLGVLFSVRKIEELGGLTDESWIVPHRNAILLALAVHVAIKAKAETVTIGCNRDDRDYPFPDCSPEFIAATNLANRAAGTSVEICAPYMIRSKAWIGGLAREMGIPSNEVYTCYRGLEKPCGNCPACKKLESALGR